MSSHIRSSMWTRRGTKLKERGRTRLRRWSLPLLTGVAGGTLILWAISLRAISCNTVVRRYTGVPNPTAVANFIGEQPKKQLYVICNGGVFQASWQRGVLQGAGGVTPQSIDPVVADRYNRAEYFSGYLQLFLGPSWGEVWSIRREDSIYLVQVFSGNRHYPSWSWAMWPWRRPLVPFWVDAWGWAVMFPIWPLPFSLCAFVSWRWAARARVWMRRNRGHCESCGYDRGGLGAGAACPECGAEATAYAARSP